MRVHEREQQVQVAKAELRLQFLTAADDAGLTDVELLQVLTSLQETVLKGMLRMERHGDPDKPAGLA